MGEEINQKMNEIKLSLQGSEFFEFLSEIKSHKFHRVVSFYWYDHSGSEAGFILRIFIKHFHKVLLAFMITFLMSFLRAFFFGSHHQKGGLMSGGGLKTAKLDGKNTKIAYRTSKFTKFVKTENCLVLKSLNNTG